MFILPAHAHPFDLVAPAALVAAHPHSWPSCTRLALACLATLALLLLVRAVLRAFVLPKVSPPSSASLPASEKTPVSPTSPTSPTSSPAHKKRTWLGLFRWETLPLPPAPDLTIPIALTAVPSPAMRGRHVYRGGRGVGFAPRARANIEAPLPAIYESETPVSMAKMIMSRHTYRRPAPPSPPAPAPKRSASHSSPVSSVGRRPPSPPTEGRSASL
ncbi:hypothetical protein C8R47DRAFT_618039 [Mycena vitilis]|nr:hypothetical protein C8R47DRAFT_618039 [Mycena vitilis]